MYRWCRPPPSRLVWAGREFIFGSSGESQSGRSGSGGGRRLSPEGRCTAPAGAAGVRCSDVIKQ